MNGFKIQFGIYWRMRHLTGVIGMRNSDSQDRHRDDENPLLDAIFRGDIALLKQRLAAGAEVDAKDRDGRSPIFQAVVDGRTDMVKELLQAGASVNLRDREGWTPLHSAAREYRLD